MRAAIELVERLGGVVAGRRGHSRVHPPSPSPQPAGARAEPPCTSPQVSLPSAWRTARGGSGSRSATSAPTVSPPACSPASTSTSVAGTDVGLAPRVSPAAPEGHGAAGSAGQGCSSVEGGACPQWLPSILLLPHEPGTRTQRQGDPQPAPAPCPQPHTFLTKHKKGFINTKRSLRASPPASSTWVCIATGATSAPACLGQGCPGRRGARGPGVTGTAPRARRGRPSLVQRCERGGGWGLSPHWQHLGFLRGADRYRSLSLLLIPEGQRREAGCVGGQGGHPGGAGPGLLTHGVADPAGVVATLQLGQHAALKGQGRHSEEEIPYVLPCPVGRDPPECPLTWLGAGICVPTPSWHSPVSEETAQYSACISWATLRASFSIRLYCAGVCQQSQAWLGDRDSQGTVCPQGGEHTHAQILLGAHQEEDHVGWVVLLQGISQPLPVGATVTGCWPSTALMLTHHSSPTILLLSPVPPLGHVSPTACAPGTPHR